VSSSRRFPTRRRTILAQSGAMAAVALGIALVGARGAMNGPFCCGIAAWTLGVALKSASHARLRSKIEAWTPRAEAIATGLLSATAELGVVPFLLWPRSVISADLRSLIAVGLGAGAVEAAFVAWLNLGALAAADTATGPDPPAGRGVGRAWMCAAPVVERVYAAAGHCATRLLVLLAVLGAGPLPAAAAWIEFSLVDGFATLAARKDLKQPRTNFRVHVVLTGLVAASVVTAIAAVSLWPEALGAPR
jgi:hypothetical protein